MQLAAYRRGQAKMVNQNNLQEKQKTILLITCNILYVTFCSFFGQVITFLDSKKGLV